MFKDITRQIAERLAETPERGPEAIKEEVENENIPVLRNLRKRSGELEASREAIQQKLDAQNRWYQRPGMPKAANYQDFHTELELLIKVWYKQPMQDRKDFVNLLVEEAVLSFPAPHGYLLTVPSWDSDTLCIYRARGDEPRWTDEEEALIREHYPAGNQIEILKLLPRRSWRAIMTRALILEVRRPRPSTNQSCPIPRRVSYQDYLFTKVKGVEPACQETIRDHLCQQKKKLYVRQ